MIGRLFFFLCGFTLLAQTSVLADDPPRVAVSIKPVHSIVAGVMADIDEPYLIVDGSRSPHTFSLKPSAARTLSNSDLIIWIGPGLELFLEKAIGTLSGNSHILTLQMDPAADPHLWLSPARSHEMVEKIQQALQTIDPGNGEVYSQNAEKLKTRLNALQNEGEKRLKSVRQKPFLVFHDAWGHFARSFSLSVAGSVALNPERPPGAKRIAEIRKLIRESAPKCLFKEPQFNSPLLKTILEDHADMKVFELDPLGADQQPGPELYFNMMEGNIAAVLECLS